MDEPASVKNCEICREAIGADSLHRRYPEPGNDRIPSCGGFKSNLAVYFHSACYRRPFSFLLRFKSVILRHVCNSCDDNFKNFCHLALRYRVLERAFVLGLVLLGLLIWLAHAPRKMDHWRDTFILVGAYVVALVHLWLAYEKGGRVWVVRHAMISDITRDIGDATANVHGLMDILGVFGRRAGPRPESLTLPTAPSKSPWIPPYSGWVFRRGLMTAPVGRKASAALANSEDGTNRSERPTDRLWRRCISGFWGEALIISFAVTVAIIIVWQCMRANIADLLVGPGAWVMAPMGAFVTIIVTDYCARQVQKSVAAGRSKSFCGGLVDAYSEYGLYSWILFGFGAVILGLILSEFILQGNAFNKSRDEIFYLMGLMQDHLTAAAHLPVGLRAGAYTEALSNAESSYGVLSHIDFILQQQLDPILVFSALVIAINISISHTFLRHLFVDDGRSYTSFFTYFPLFFIAAAGLFIYFGSYEYLLDKMALDLEKVKVDSSIAGWEIVKRLSEITEEVDRGRNIFGFAAAVGGASSGAPLFLAFIKEILDRTNTREAIVDAGGELFRRPSVRFRPTSRTPQSLARDQLRQRTERREKARPDNSLRVAPSPADGTNAEGHDAVGFVVGG